MYKDLKRDISINGSVIIEYNISNQDKQGDALILIIFTLATDPL